MISKHSVCFACPCRTVCKHGCIFTCDNCFYQWFNCFLVYFLRALISIDFIEGISLLFRAVQYIQHFLIFHLKLSLDRVKNNLKCTWKFTMRLSCVLMTSQSSRLTYFWLSGLTLIATKILDSPSYFFSFSFYFILNII